MRCKWQVASLLLVLACVVSLSSIALAGLPNVKDKVKQKAKDKAAEQTAQQTQDPEQPEEQAEEPADDTAPMDGQPTGSATAGKPGEGVWVNYDFIPGSRVIFADDFTHDTVGNFPQRLELLEGNMEVAEYKGRRWVQATTWATFNVPLPEDLPARFTVEFDLLSPSGYNEVQVRGVTPDDYNGESYPTEAVYSPTNLRAGLINAGPKDADALTYLTDDFLKQLLHCRIMADGKYVKVYTNEKRVANFPNTDFYRSNGVQFYITAEPDYPLLIGDIRVAASDKTMYDALAADGRVITQGIFFDTGSDRIRPESTPTLKEIGQMLKDHPDLRLRIEGHTDSVGEDAANLTLSQSRAAAVQKYLVSEQGVDTGRLESQGLGETKPVASNDTPEGRQNNRRVELVKL